jgi:hypothetical protein
VFKLLGALLLALPVLRLLRVLLHQLLLRVLLLLRHQLAFQRFLGRRLCHLE